MKAFLTIDEPTTQIVRSSLERIYNLTYIKTVNFKHNIQNCTRQFLYISYKH
jgi:hypothetical protein